MVKIVSFSPLPEGILRALISSVYNVDVKVVVINEFDEDAIVEAVRDAEIVIGDYTFKIPITERGGEYREGAEGRGGQACCDRVREWMQHTLLRTVWKSSV